LFFIDDSLVEIATAALVLAACRAIMSAAPDICPGLSPPFPARRATSRAIGAPTGGDEITNHL
jgi:hypothetical protein